MSNQIQAIEALIEISKGQLTINEIYEKYNRINIIAHLEPLLVVRFQNNFGEFFKLTRKGTLLLSSFAQTMKVVTNL